MLSLILCLSLFSPGETDAMDAFADGELYLVTFGRPPAEIFRDSLTGIRFRSMGCVLRDGDMEYQEDWNGFMIDAWNGISGPGTYFVLRNGSESIEYSDGSCIYRDSWGSVPVDLYPEELARIVWLSRAEPCGEEVSSGYLELFVPSMEDTVRVAVNADSEVIRELFQRGGTAIRTNTVN